MSASKKQLTTEQQEAANAIISNLIDPQEARRKVDGILNVLTFAVLGMEDIPLSEDASLGLLDLICLCKNLNQLAA